MTEILADDMIDLAKVELEILMIERRKYLEKHRFAIYQGKDGAWYTYLAEKTISTIDTASFLYSGQASQINHCL